MIFQVGDSVTWAGANGKVIDPKDCALEGHILVLFEGDDDREGEWFYADGKLYDWHTEPSLKFVRRAV